MNGMQLPGEGASAPADRLATRRVDVSPGGLRAILQGDVDG